MKGGEEEVFEFQGNLFRWRRSWDTIEIAATRLANDTLSQRSVEIVREGHDLVLTATLDFKIKRHIVDRVIL